MDERRIATYDDTGKIPVERIPNATLPIQVVAGAEGASAYDIAVANGFAGTEAEWLISLVGAPGSDGGSHPHPYAPDPHAIDGARHTGAEVLPTQGQKNALAGTQGTPGDLNRFVTHQDPRLADARPPAAHAHAPAEVTGTAVVTADPRLSDARTPTAHAHQDADLPAGIARDAEVAAAYAAIGHTHPAGGAPVYAALAAGSTAMAFGTNDSVKVTPNANATYTTTVPAAGKLVTLIVLTSGTTSRTITFGTGFKPVTATLATGTVTARVFVLTFVSDGANLYEVSRTAAMAA